MLGGRFGTEHQSFHCEPTPRIGKVQRQALRDGIHDLLTKEYRFFNHHQQFARACEKWCKKRDAEAAASAAAAIAASAAGVVAGSRKAKALVALLELGAVPDGPVKAKKEVVPKADPLANDANAWADVFDGLRKDGLIESVGKGPASGFRLTVAGQKRAKELAEKTP
jgi:hypothetical protein